MDRLRGLDVSCAILRGQPREIQDVVYFDPPKRGLSGVQMGFVQTDREKGCSGRPSKKLAEGHWRYFETDGWQSTQLDPAFFCWREGGCVRGMIIVHVDDMLLASDGRKKVKLRVQRLLWIRDVKEAKRAAEKDGVLHCGRRIKVEDDILWEKGGRQSSKISQNSFARDVNKHPWDEPERNRKGTCGSAGGDEHAKHGM